MKSVSLRAPAKLNLGLRLVGIREDGYHEIESIFAPIDLWDGLEIELLSGAHQIELEVGLSAGQGLPPELAAVSAGPDNLVFRAAEAFCRARDWNARIRIRLEKGIPAAAGLGGGSSDAAAVLNGLAALSGEPIDREALASIALSLGADVPFFLEPQAALVEGVGERILPLEGLPGADLVVANPGFSLATAEVYRAADALGNALTEPRPGSTMRAFSRLSWEIGAPGDKEASALWSELLVNDLEPAATRLCPPVGRWLGGMREAGATAVAMTGSGATVFGVFDSNRAASEAAEWLRQSSVWNRDHSWLQVSRLLV